jgi:hypothetical protein
LLSGDPKEESYDIFISDTTNIVMIFISYEQELYTSVGGHILDQFFSHSGPQATCDPRDADSRLAKRHNTYY